MATVTITLKDEDGTVSVYVNFGEGVDADNGTPAQEMAAFAMLKINEYFSEKD